MKPAYHCRAIATCITLASLAALTAATAADISIMVADRGGNGVGEVVVTAMPSAAGPSAAGVRPSTAAGPTVMDQRNLMFVPGVLAVPVGASVEFPNNDSVSHQVYSFSPAKHFQLPLYKGEVHPPITFDKPGLVVLGCNIHDAMVGYVLVTDAPYFGVTEARGGLQLKGLPDGDYRITIWSPYITDAAASLTRTVHVNGGEPANGHVEWHVGLRAQPEPKPRRHDWEY
jgi:plastocyanin